MDEKDWRTDEPHAEQLERLAEHGGTYTHGMTAGEVADAIKRAVALRRYEKVKKSLADNDW
jgi:hypothetical protein